MIGFPANTRVWIAAGVTDLRRGFTGLSALVQTKLEQSPFSGHVFVFRGRRGDLIKVLWYDGDGLCLFAKRLERGRFVWPQATSGTVSLTRAAVDVAGRHRLAAAGAHLAAGAVGVTEEILLHRFFAPLRVQHESFMRYSAHVSGDASRPG
jgi:transposase